MPRYLMLSSSTNYISHFYCICTSQQHSFGVFMVQGEYFSQVFYGPSGLFELVRARATYFRLPNDVDKFVYEYFACELVQ